MGNYSKQRQEIIKIIEQMDKFPTAEEIYYKIKQNDSTISKSTVYRNLNYFVKNRNLLQIPISNGADKYFYNYSGKDYGFVICEKCEKIHEFICNFDINLLEKNIIIQTGTSIIKSGMIFKGVCGECALK